MSDVKNLDNILCELSKGIKIHIPTQQEQEEAHKHYIKWQIENPNNFSYWFPKVAPYLEERGIKSPKSKVIPVPENVMEACFLEKKTDADLIQKWVHTEVMPALRGAEFPLFMKNGCFSNKFDFRGSCMLTKYDEQSIADNFANLQSMSLFYDTGGNMEVVFRAFIKPSEDTPTIYNGMPFRPEMRIFYDFDNHSYCYAVNYWDWDYCHDRIAEEEHDKEVYESYYPKLKEMYEYRMHYFLPRILAGLRRVDKMTGTWSLDFILDEHEAWFIDAAVACQSAYWDADWESKGLGKL